MDVKLYTEMPKEQWDEYVAKIDGSTFNYTSVKIDFDTDYSTGIVKNESAVFLVDNKPVGIAVVYVEELKDQEYTIGWSGGFGVVPLIQHNTSYKLQEKYMEKLLEYIENVALKYNCKKVMLRFDPLCNPENDCKLYNYNVLMKEGYTDKSTLSQIIDLSLDQDKLKSMVRKGHKSDIKRGNYEIEFYDKTNMSQNIIEEYKRIYELDAGKVTRNSQMYQHYYNFVVDEKAIIALAKKNGENVAVLIATFYKDTAYYSSYAELTEKLSGIPVGHQLQWNTMLELKRRGIHYYEIGEQVFGSYEKGTEEAKLVNISNFKRGFGGYTVPFFRGVKYLNID